MPAWLATIAAALAAGAAGGPGVAPERVAPPRCAPEAANCVEAEGTIVALEAVDPDGDGDAHFVLLDAAGITGPGISVIDVARELRPDPLPGPGERLAAAGPLYRGSFGQRQVQAERVAVLPAGDGR